MKIILLPQCLVIQIKNKAWSNYTSTCWFFLYTRSRVWTYTVSLTSILAEYSWFDLRTSILEINFMICEYKNYLRIFLFWMLHYWHLLKSPFHYQSLYHQHRHSTRHSTHEYIYFFKEKKKEKKLGLEDNKNLTMCKKKRKEKKHYLNLKLSKLWSQEKLPPTNFPFDVVTQSHDSFLKVGSSVLSHPFLWIGRIRIPLHYHTVIFFFI